MKKLYGLYKQFQEVEELEGKGPLVDQETGPTEMIASPIVLPDVKSSPQVKRGPGEDPMMNVKVVTRQPQ
jgi:hypothetical protein